MLPFVGKTEGVLSCLCLPVCGIAWQKQNTWVPAVALEAKEVGIKDGTAFTVFCIL